MSLSADPVKRGRQLANLVDAPPAPPENERARKSGAWATHKTLPVESLAEVIYAELEAEAPLRDGDGGLPMADRAAVELAALCLCRLRSAAEWIEEHGLVDGKGRPWPVIETERRLRNEAREHLRDLGLTPRARVGIGLALQGASKSLAELLSDLDEEDGTDA